MISERENNLIKRVLSKAIANNELAGANILICHNGREVFYHEDGFSNIQSQLPLKRDTIFRLYSMTKPVTAASIMILLERGEIDLFDPVYKYIPSFKHQKVVSNGEIVPLKRDLTIKDLLNMTSGLLYPGTCVAGESVDLVFKELDNRLFTNNEMDTMEFVSRLGECFLAFQPGDEWAYGTSADVLGGIIEVISNKSLGQFMADELFIPLGMNDTGFYLPDYKLDRLATVYESKTDGFNIYSGNNLGVTNSMYKKPAFESGGAGLVSTIDDYSKFALMLMNKGSFNGVEILKTETVKFFTSQVLTEKQSSNLAEWFALSGFSYGNLMRIMNKPDLCGTLSCLGEYGWDGWLGCYMANIPLENLTILIMMQKKDAGTISFTRRVRNIVLSGLKHN